MRTSKELKTRNEHRRTSVRDFLKGDGILEEVEAAALKRALALKVADLMEKRDFDKSTMAAEMRTSRAAINRILDPENTSVTLTNTEQGCQIAWAKTQNRFSAGVRLLRRYRTSDSTALSGEV